MSLRQDSLLDDRYLARGLAWDYAHGEQLPEHHHSWAQLVYAESGVMQVRTHDTAWLVPPTRAIWIPGDVSHWIRMQGSVDMRTLYLPVAGEPWPGQCQALEVSPLLRELILYIVRERWLDPDRHDHRRLLGVLGDLIEASGNVPLALPMPVDPRARSMAERIVAAPGRSDPLKALAADTGASLRTLQRLFLIETGLPLELWRLRARMQLAIVMLSGGDSVTNTALACGYANPGAFTTAFKRLFGVTPSRYSQML